MALVDLDAAPVTSVGLPSAHPESNRSESHLLRMVNELPDDVGLVLVQSLLAAEEFDALCGGGDDGVFREATAISVTYHDAALLDVTNAEGCTPSSIDLGLPGGVIAALLGAGHIAPAYAVHLTLFARISNAASPHAVFVGGEDGLFAECVVGNVSIFTGSPEGLSNCARALANSTHLTVLACHGLDPSLAPSCSTFIRKACPSLLSDGLATAAHESGCLCRFRILVAVDDAYRQAPEFDEGPVCATVDVTVDATVVDEGDGAVHVTLVNALPEREYPVTECFLRRLGECLSMPTAAGAGGDGAAAAPHLLPCVVWLGGDRWDEDDEVSLLSAVEGWAVLRVRTHAHADESFDSTW